MSDARIDYIELPSATAHELTRAFYSKAFGWTFTDYGPEYAATTNGVTDVDHQLDDVVSGRVTWTVHGQTLKITNGATTLDFERSHR